MFNEQIRPAAFYLRRLGVAQKKHYFCLRLALKIVLRRKKKCSVFPWQKKTLGNCSHSPSLRLSTPSRPMKNLRASRLLGCHPRRHLLESMLSREHALMSSILENLVSRREHWRCRRSPNLGCCPSTNSLLIDGLKRGKTDLPW